MDRLTFGETLPSVQKMAALKIAVSLWSNFLFGGSCDDDEDELYDAIDEKYRERVEKLVDPLTIPSQMKELVKECLREIETEYDNWINYNKYEILPREKISVCRSHLKCCVWQQNGRIDYKRSAVKMLELDGEERLDEEEKFGVMSKFCLVEEITKVTPEKVPRSYVDGLDFVSGPLVYYWMCYVRNELHKIEIGEATSIDAFMIARGDLDNWHAIEYFWNRLNEIEQVNAAVTMLTTQHPGQRHQKRLLSLMNGFQQKELFARIPVNIIVNFWIALAEGEMAFMVWQRVKDALSGDQFATLIRTILTDSRYSEEHIPALIKLWDSAGDHLKRYFVDYKEEIIVRNFFSSDYCTLPYSLHFLCSVLSYASPEYRRDLVLNRGDHLAVNYPFDEVHKVIKLCFPNAEDAIKFKKSLANSSKVKGRCKFLFETGDFQYLNKFLDFYAPNEAVNKELKKRTIESNDIGSVNIFHPSKWSELSKLIDNAYPDAAAAEAIKSRYVLNSASECYYNWNEMRELHVLQDLTSKFLSEEQLGTLKNLLLQKFRDRLMDGHYWRVFDESYLNEFTRWCSGSEQGVMEFKRSLPMDEICNNIIEVMMVRYIYEDEFIDRMLAVADRFLEWYLADKQQAKEYKFNKVLAYNDIEIIEASIARREPQYTKILVNWFLSNDQELICKFKSNFCNDMISKMI